MKRQILMPLIIAVLIIIFLLLMAGYKNKHSNKKITVVGSTALQPLMEEAANNYQKNQSGISITVQGGGSGTGLSQLQSGAITLGNSDVFAETQKGIYAPDLIDHKIAVVGITPIVNKKVGISNISSTDLKKIFTGQITNWHQVGGKNQKISIINRIKGSGTRSTFEDNVLHGDLAIKSQEQDSNGTVRKIVATTPGAISYLSFSFVDSSLQSLSINHIKPTRENVINHRWKIWSYEHVYTQRKIDVSTRAFLKFIYSKKIQVDLVNKLGYISIHDMKVKRNAKNQIVNE